MRSHDTAAGAAAARWAAAFFEDENVEEIAYAPGPGAMLAACIQQTRLRRAQQRKAKQQAVALHTELPKRSVNAKNGVSTASIDDFMTTGGSYWPGPGTNAVLAAATSSRVVDDLNGTNDGLAAPNALPRL